MSMSREQAVAEAFVELSDTLVADIDVVEFLHLLTGRCVQLLDVQVAGVMVGDQGGVLRLTAASAEYGRLLELFEIQAAPSAASFCTGEPVTVLGLDPGDARWPRFARQAYAAGFRSMYALPMRLRGEVIGVLALLRTQAGALGGDEVRLGQALANVTTVGLLQHRSPAQRQVLGTQLRHVLNSRVLIERAKGVLAERLDIGIDAARDELLRHSERVGRPLNEIARLILDRDHGDTQPDGDPIPDLVPLVRRFDFHSLAALRTVVRHRLSAAGVQDSSQVELLLAIHEAMANAVRHGGGYGRLWLWSHTGSLWCEISDDGPGFPPDVTLPVSLPEGTEHGRGLWIINHVFGSPDITASPTGGTRMLLHYRLPTSADLG
jgi:anti-sigma regulatory factor (Ser/Thr protein kinase)